MSEDGQWVIVSGEEAQMMRLKQTIREVFNELDFRCPKCKCKGKDE